MNVFACLTPCLFTCVHYCCVYPCNRSVLTPLLNSVPQSRYACEHRIMSSVSNRGRVCMCVSPVHCLSQEWETSEYLWTTNRVNAACQNLLWEHGYGWCCTSPPHMSRLFILVAPWVLSNLCSCHQWDILVFILLSFLHESLPSTFLPYQWNMPPSSSSKDGTRSSVSSPRSRSPPVL